MEIMRRLESMSPDPFFHLSIRSCVGDPGGAGESVDLLGSAAAVDLVDRSIFSQFKTWFFARQPILLNAD